jgi:hypothetical protein
VPAGAIVYTHSPQHNWYFRDQTLSESANEVIDNNESVQSTSSSSRGLLGAHPAMTTQRPAGGNLGSARTQQSSPIFDEIVSAVRVIDGSRDILPAEWERERLKYSSLNSK